MKAIILAGGLGTRLRSEVSDLPKVMAQVGNRPFLEHLLDNLIQNGIKSFVFSIGYLGECIENHLGTSYKNSPISYAKETERLGTGGAILNAMQFVSEENVVIVNGDSLVQTDLKKQFQAHCEKNADVTLVLKKMFDFDRYGTVALNSEGRITNFLEKQPMSEGLINTGVYIFNVKKLEALSFPKVFSIEKDFFEEKIDELWLNGELTDGYFLDIGIPEDFKRAQFEIGVFPLLDENWEIVLEDSLLAEKDSIFESLIERFPNKNKKQKIIFSKENQRYKITVQSESFPSFFKNNSYFSDDLSVFLNT